MKKNFESLVEEAITNIREDREQTKDLLRDLIKYLGGAEDRHRDVGLIAAKYVETLQRSNEQLVKISGLKQKEEKGETGLTSEERDEIFNELNEEEQMTEPNNESTDIPLSDLNPIAKPTILPTFDPTNTTAAQTMRKVA